MFRWLCIFFLFITFSQNTIAQSVFFKKITGGGFGGRVIQTTDGGFLFSGNKKLGDSDDNYELYIIKFNSSGSIQWRKKITGPSGISGLLATRPLVTQLKNGNFVLAGTASASNTDENSILIIRFNPTGGVVWQKAIDGPDDEYLRSIASTPDGGFVIAGVQSSSSFLSGLVVKLNSSGDIEWSRLYSDTDDETSHIVPAPDGGYLLQSHLLDFDSDWFLQINVKKLDPAGQITWNKNIRGDNAGIWPGGVTVTTDGDYIIAGEHITNEFGSRGMLIKLAESGNVLWKKIYRGAGVGVSFHSVAVTLDGGFVAGGCSTPLNSEQCSSFVTKVNSTGKVLWKKNFNVLAGEEEASVYPTSDDGVILTDRQIDPPSVNGDIFVLKLDSKGAAPSCLQTDSPNVSVQSPGLKINDSTTDSRTVSLNISKTSFQISNLSTPIVNVCN